MRKGWRAKAGIKIVFGFLSKSWEETPDSSFIYIHSFHTNKKYIYKKILIFQIQVPANRQKSIISKVVRGGPSTISKGFLEMVHLPCLVISNSNWLWLGLTQVLLIHFTNDLQTAFSIAFIFIVRHSSTSFTGNKLGGWKRKEQK